MKLSELLEIFTGQKSHRRETVFTYKKKINKFINWYGNDPEIEEITDSVIFRYKNSFIHDGLSEAYGNSCLRHLKAVLAFAFKSEMIDINPFVDVKMHRNSKTPRKTIHKDDISLSIRKLIELENKKSRRYRPQYFFRMLIRFFALVPPRRGQVVGLNWDDIDLQGRWLKLRPEVVGCKSGLYNTVPIPEKLLSYLVDFRVISEFKHKQLNCNYKFETSQVFNLRLHQDSTTFKPFTRDEVSQFFYRFSVREGFNLSAQRFRHSIATNLLNNNTDIKSVQRLLTHESIASTMVYLHGRPEKHLAKLLDIDPLI